jgi:hypothetical protein
MRFRKACASVETIVYDFLVGEVGLDQFDAHWSRQEVNWPVPPIKANRRSLEPMLGS